MRRGPVGAAIAVAVLVAACSTTAGESEVEPTTPTLATSVVATTTSAASTISAAPVTVAPTTIAPPTTLAEPVAETDVGVLAAFVEEHSGLVFDVEPEVETASITRDELDIDPGMFVAEALWDLLVPLGLVEPDDDRIAAGQARLDQVRGVCCPVVLFDTDDHPLLESVVVVHELTHLIDRQRPFDREVRSPEPFPFTTIVLEGNAQRVALRYRAELEAAGARPTRFDLDWTDPRIPAAVLEVLELPYDEGARFSAELVARGGLAAVGESFLRPPISTEQVLDVDAYLAGELPVEVEPPPLPARAEPIATGTIGSFVLRLLAEQTLDDAAAHGLAISWAGDRYALFDQAGRRCLAATVRMDDIGATATLVDALHGAGVGAVISSDAPTELTVRRCAAPPEETRRPISVRHDRSWN